MKQSQSESKLGLQRNLFKSPFSLRRVLEDFKSDYLTLDEAIIQINESSTEEKDPEETDLKFKPTQYKFDL